MFAGFIVSCGAAGEAGFGDPCELVCGEHEVCQFALTGPECICATGYEGDPCEWGTVPDDPEFATPGAWSDEASGVTILSTTPGLGPGLAWIDETALCNGGMVTQLVEMPDRNVAEPFVFEMTHRSNKTFGIDVYANRALRTVQQAGSAAFVTQRFCLGEAAYGGSVEFRIGGAERDSACESMSRGLIEVDRFSIVPAEPNECPEPGFALNGEANPEDGGWWFDEEDVNPIDGIATAALEPGVGRGGTGGARLFQDGGGNLVTMGTQISVPLPGTDGPAPALRFWWKGDGMEVFPAFGTPRNNFSVNALEYLLGDGEEHINTYCLPPWTYGSVVELWFVPLGGVSAGDFVVDDVKVISDPNCRIATDILDPSFDSAPNHWPGFTFGRTDVDQPVVIRDDTIGGSPSGGGAIVLSYASNQAIIQFHHWVWVPETEAGRIPVLAFYSRLSNDPGLHVAGLVSRNSMPTPGDHLAAGVGWQWNEYCLPGGWSGRWLRFRVDVRDRSAEPPPVQAFDPPKEVWLDDFQTTSSAGCPD